MFLKVILHFLFIFQSHQRDHTSCNTTQTLDDALHVVVKEFEQLNYLFFIGRLIDGLGDFSNCKQ